MGHDTPDLKAVFILDFDIGVSRILSLKGCETVLRPVAFYGESPSASASKTQPLLGAPELY